MVIAFLTHPELFEPHTGTPASSVKKKKKIIERLRGRRSSDIHRLCRTDGHKCVYEKRNGNVFDFYNAIRFLKGNIKINAYLGPAWKIIIYGKIVIIH